MSFPARARSERSSKTVCEANDSFPLECGHLRYSRIQSGNTMFPKTFVSLLFICQALHSINSPIAYGLQSGAPSAVAPNNTDGFAPSTPVMTFIDPSNGQLYGRYVVTESVPVVAYSYQEVKERVYVPKSITENKTTTETQNIPIYSQQLQPQNVNSWNPFAPPQQVWRYVPIVHYQPNYVQVTRPVTYQKYEEREVSRMVPVLSSQSVPARRYEDRRLGQSPNGSNMVASNQPNFMSVSNNPNLIQQAAQIAEANRSTSRFSSRPIDYPYNPSYRAAPNRPWLAQAPPPYYPNPNFNPAPYYPPNNQVNPSTAANNQASATYLVLPAVPLRPDPNTMAGYYGNGANGTPNFAAMPTQAYPYANTASRPFFNWSSFTAGAGSLFSNSLFSNNRSPNYVASNTPAAQPYMWGLNNQNGINFRPNTSPYATPEQGWGMAPGTNYRDPMQGGMPATVLR